MENRNITLYALSTCIWCRKTKRLLEDMGIAFNAVDVDLLDPEAKEKAKTEVRRFNPETSYPTLVVDNEKSVVGYDETKIREILK